MIGNHFNSKGGDDPTFGRFQEPRAAERGAAPRPGATSLNAFVKQHPRDRPALTRRRARRPQRLRVLGDRPSRLEHGRALVDLWHFVPQDEHYSYVFQGNGQVLDHILVSPALLLQGHPDLDAVHINAEFSDQVSDHDPPITRLDVR